VVTGYRTISVRVGPEVERRLERAASLMKQSRGAFLQKAGDETARRILVDWAAKRHRNGEKTFSELAVETGLTIEEIMAAVGRAGQAEGAGMFLASARVVAETMNSPSFLRMAEHAAAVVAASAGGPPASEAPAAIGNGVPSVRWRQDGERLIPVAVTEEQRRTLAECLAGFRVARTGERGGSHGPATELEQEIEAGYLSRKTVQQFSKWCHSSGPSYRGKAQRAAHALSKVLFGRVIPLLDDTPTGDQEWLALGER
jgi:hypothetical protein